MTYLIEKGSSPNLSESGKIYSETQPKVHINHTYKNIGKKVFSGWTKCGEIITTVIVFSRSLIILIACSTQF